MPPTPEPDITVTLPRSELYGMFIEMCSEVSERCYCASWMSGHEEALPSLCAEAIRTGEGQGYGQDELTFREAQTLTTLAQALGGWEEALRPKMEWLRS